MGAYLPACGARQPRRLLLEPLEQRRLLALDLAAIGGTAFADLTGNGLTADDPRLSGATVELYRDNGDNTFSAATDTLLGTTTTNASGVYRFASTNAGGLLPAFTLTADDYFVRQLPVVGYSPPAAALVTITSTEVAGTTVQTVDTFDATEQVVTANSVTPTASSPVAATEAIGGERDVLVTYTSGTGDATVEIDRFNSNVFAFACGLSVVGTARIQYDGPDGDATVLAPTGLGGVSLSGGDANAGLLVATRGDSVTTAELRVYSNATNFSTTTITIPDQLPIEEIFVPFSAFTVGGGAGATFTSVGAIELLINGVSDLDATATAMRGLRPTEIVSNLANTASSMDLVAFAKALTAAGAKLFGAAWSSDCTVQRELFEDGGDFLPFIEVTNPDRTLNQIGIDENVTQFPTWQFPDGSRQVGALSLETISTRSGVAIPTSVNPFVAPIGTQTVLGGSPLHLALNGYDPNGGTLTYTVTSSKPSLVEPVVLSGNRSVEVDFSAWGSLVFELFDDRVPVATGRFVTLVDQGFYDAANNSPPIGVHRSINNFMFQFGDPTGTGSGGSSLGTFDDDFDVELQHNKAGMLAWAKSSQDDTANSQVYVTDIPTRHLDFNHPVFGVLTEGDKIRDAINLAAVNANSQPTPPITIQSARVFQDQENRVLMLKAAENAAGEADITVTVSDKDGNQYVETFHVVVSPDPYDGGPFLEDIPPIVTTMNVPATFQLSAVDVEGGPVRFSGVRLGSVAYTFSVDETTGQVTVTPPPDFNGTMDFQVRVRPQGTSNTQDLYDTQTVTVTVLPTASSAVDLAATGGTAYVDLTNNGLTADDTRISGATVLLYRDNGDNTFDSGTDTLLGTTTTNASGVYRFASTNAGGTLPAFTLTADDYFVRQLPVVGYAPPAAALVTITSTEVNGTTVQTVDTFNLTEQVVTANSATPTAGSSLAAPEAIGAERDVLVNYTSGVGEATVEIDRLNSNVFAFVSGLDVVGTALVQYDGIDNDATALNAVGLGGVSMSDGDANAGLLIATRGDSVGATAQLRVYSSAANFSVATITIPDQPTIEEIFVPFSAFALGGGSGADFDSVGAMELFINSVPDLDATVSVLRSLRPNQVVLNLENDVPSVQIAKFTNGLDANTVGSGPFVAVGTTVTFTYVVTSTGGTSLQNVVVRDDNGTPGNTTDDINPTFMGGDTNGNSQLDPTETWTFTATRVVTAGAHTNEGRVTAEDTGGTQVTDTDPSNHFGVVAQVNIEKWTNGQHANSPTGPLLLVGSTATFTYLVTNRGNVPLATVVVTDDNGTSGNPGDDFNPTFHSGDTNSNGRLDPDEFWFYQATRIVTLGQHTNVGTVTANPVDTTGADIAGMSDATDTDPSNHLGIIPGINVVKSTNGQDANTVTGPVLAVGSTATFTYVVTNTGNAALATVVLTDDNGTPGNPGDNFNPTFQSGDTNANGRFEPTEIWTYTATRVVTAGQHTNIATVTANPVDGAGADIPGVADVSDTDPSNHFGFTAGIAVQKLTNGIDTGTGSGPTLAIGSTATFTYNVTNTGNVSLTNVVLTDNNGTPANAGDDFSPVRIGGDTDGDNQLDVTETWVYQATRVVTAGAYSNSVMVTANDPNTTLVSATDLSAHTGGDTALFLSSVPMGATTRLDVRGVTPGGLVTFLRGTALGAAFLPAFGITVGIADSVVVAQGIADGTGYALALVDIPPQLAGQTVYFQAFEQAPKLQVSNVISAGRPLRAEGGEGCGGTAISVDAVRSVLSAAIERWEDAGLWAGQAARLRSVTVRVEDLPGGVLAYAADDTVTIDVTGAGHGWFVDASPTDDREFGRGLGGSLLLAATADAAAGRIDLLTVIMHELGHVLGIPDVAARSAASPLMWETLSVGRRAVPQYYTNRLNPNDVNDDGLVTPLDALLVINVLNMPESWSPYEEPGADNARRMFWDTNHDFHISPVDALLVINALNRRESEMGEGESSGTDAAGYDDHGIFGQITGRAIIDGGHGTDARESRVGFPNWDVLHAVDRVDSHGLDPLAVGPVPGGHVVDRDRVFASLVADPRRTDDDCRDWFELDSHAGYDDLVDTVFRTW